MLSGIKNFGSLAVGQMSCEISLPIRPSFSATEVSRAVGAEKQYIVGLANYENQTQDMLTIWLPKKLVAGEQPVMYGTGLLRIKNGGIPLLLGLTGSIFVEFPGGAEHVKGKFNLLGTGFSVVGTFDIRGIDPIDGAEF